MAKSKRSSKRSSRRSETSGAAGGTSGSRNTRERRAEREREKRRQRVTTTLGLIVAFVVIGFVLVVLVNQPADAPIPDGVLERYAGIPQAPAEDGFFVLGNPDAPVRVVEYSSFSCEFCRDLWRDATDSIIDLVMEGVISFKFVPRYTGGIRNGEAAARAALCAGEQGYFFEMHDALFTWHSDFGNRAFSQNRLEGGGSALAELLEVEGVEFDSGEYSSCINSSRTDRLIGDADRLASANGVSGPPTTFVNGVQVSSSADAIRQQAISALGNQQPLPPVMEGDDPFLDEPATDDMSEEEPMATDEPEAEATEAEATEDASDEADAESMDEEEDDNADAEATEEASN